MTHDNQKDHEKDVKVTFIRCQNGRHARYLFENSILSYFILLTQSLL